jgi:hypothetical protein
MEYYQHDLALVHARGFGQHADRCSPGVLDLLAPVRGGLVLEVGCGAGALTRRDGHGADVVRRRGAAARDARRDRGQNLTRAGPS